MHVRHLARHAWLLWQKQPECGHGPIKSAHHSWQGKRRNSFFKYPMKNTSFLVPDTA